jgi:hypothetical protein
MLSQDVRGPIAERMQNAYRFADERSGPRAGLVAPGAAWNGTAISARSLPDDPIPGDRSARFRV